METIQLVTLEKLTKKEKQQLIQTYCSSEDLLPKQKKVNIPEHFSKASTVSESVPTPEYIPEPVTVNEFNNTAVSATVAEQHHKKKIILSAFLLVATVSLIGLVLYVTFTPDTSTKDISKQADTSDSDILSSDVSSSVTPTFASDEVVTSKTKGNISYELYGNGQLTISGSGIIPSDIFMAWSDEEADISYGEYYVLRTENDTTYGGTIYYGEDSDLSINTVIIKDGITSIGETGNLAEGDGTFAGWKNLEKVTIPDSVTNIGYSSFSSCVSLTSITIPDSVTKISNSAFSGCSALTEIKLSKNLTSIEYSVFADCEGLKEITIPDGVTSIKANAFRDCVNLEKITIPESVKEINSAFRGCYSITIHCQSGSYAEKYAKENKIDYVAE